MSKIRSRRRPFVITVKGRRYRFATLEAAELTARIIFNDTGIVVGIERAS
jgi:hypothetical protein